MKCALEKWKKETKWFDRNNFYFFFITKGTNFEQKLYIGLHGVVGFGFNGQFWHH